MDPQVNIVSSQAAHRGDNKPLAAMLDQLVDPASPPPPDEPQHPARTASSTYAPPAAGPRATDPGPARRFRDRVEVTDLAAGKARHASPERGTHWWKRRRDPMRRVGDSSQMKLRVVIGPFGSEPAGVRARLAVAVRVSRSRPRARWLPRPWRRGGDGSRAAPQAHDRGTDRRRRARARAVEAGHERGRKREQDLGYDAGP
jgi:hypothetical protein